MLKMHELGTNLVQEAAEPRFYFPTSEGAEENR